MSKKGRKKYREVEETDDEDDMEDRRSIFSHNDRNERKSLGGRFPERQRPSRDTSSVPREIARRNTIDRVERISNVRSRPSVRQSSSESDDEHSESQKEESEIVEEGSEQDTGPKPLPELPNANWECEHCTFVNEAGTKVCLVCCKTASVNVKLVQNEESQNLAPKNLPKSKQNKEQNKLQRSRSSDDYSKDYSETESLLNKLGKLKTSEPPKEVPAEPKKGKDGCVSPSASELEDKAPIVSLENGVPGSAVNSSVGTDDSAKDKVTMSTGTSPPPQNMSTQVLVPTRAC
jgi:E3 ubiquitin-protein ligase RNF31